MSILLFDNCLLRARSSDWRKFHFIVVYRFDRKKNERKCFLVARQWLLSIRRFHFAARFLLTLLYCWNVSIVAAFTLLRQKNEKCEFHFCSNTATTKGNAWKTFFFISASVFLFLFRWTIKLSETFCHGLENLRWFTVWLWTPVTEWTNVSHLHRRILTPDDDEAQTEYFRCAAHQKNSAISCFSFYPCVRNRMCRQEKKEKWRKTKQENVNEKASHRFLLKLKWNDKMKWDFSRRCCFSVHLVSFHLHDSLVGFLIFSHFSSSSSLSSSFVCLIVVSTHFTHVPHTIRCVLFLLLFVSLRQPWRWGRIKTTADAYFKGFWLICLRTWSDSTMRNRNEEINERRISEAHWFQTTCSIVHWHILSHRITKIENPFPGNDKHFDRKIVQFFVVFIAPKTFTTM